ncbi:MAG: LON peptidase substrate-binding domain-containing protein [Fidelibacterota bacterium]|jgi:Lon protease-like protein|tara:strand:- start:2220 stop:2804 length:585 start_codon:yes stop_codon:yes gene_type:complete
MSRLPLFPLNLILLPYEVLPLHIFENRYKVMVKNAIDYDTPFGIILNEKKGIYSKGCKVKITKVFKEYENGEYDILVKGMDRFNVIDTNMDGDTIFGEVEFILPDAKPDLLLINKIQDAYLKVLIKYGVDNNLDHYMNKKISYDFLSGIQLPIELKKALIDLDVETERLNFINQIFNNILKSSTKPSNGHTHEA